MKKITNFLFTAFTYLSIIVGVALSITLSCAIMWVISCVFKIEFNLVASIIISVFFLLLTFIFISITKYTPITNSLDDEYEDYENDTSKDKERDQFFEHCVLTKWIADNSKELTDNYLYCYIHFEGSEPLRYTSNVAAVYLKNIGNLYIVNDISIKKDICYLTLRKL